MAKSEKNLKAVFTDTADAIREKEGSTGKISPLDFADRIKAISTGIEPTGTINIAQNGTYDVTEYASAVVDVAGSSSSPKLNAPTISWTNGTDILTTSFPSSNGDYDTGMKVYNNMTLIKSFSSLNSSLNFFNNLGLSLNTIYEKLCVSVTGSNFIESNKSNTISFGKMEYAITHDDYVKGTISDSGTCYYGNTLSCTFGVYDGYVLADKVSIVSVTNPSSSAYTFVDTGNGYYESNNKAKSSTYAYAKITFTVEEDLSDLQISYVNSGEANYDYGTISKIDTDLGMSTSDDSSTLYAGYFKGASSTDTKTLSLGAVTAGEHYITIKYRKDGSGDSNNDSLRIMMTAVESTTRFMPPEITVTSNGVETTNYTYNSFTGAFSMKPEGKVAITINSVTYKTLLPPTGKISGETLSWTAVDNASGYSVKAYNKTTDTTATWIESTTETSLTLTDYIPETDKDEYQIYVKTLGDDVNFYTSSWSNAIGFSRGIQVYGVTFAGNAIDGTRIDACEGVTNDQVGIGYYGESAKAENWFDDKAPFAFEIVNLTMRDSSGNALIDSSTNSAITAPFVKRKNFYVKITDNDDGGQTWEVATGAKDGFSPMYTNFDGTIPEYIYQSVYPFCQLNCSGTYYGAQRGRQILYSHNYNSADHYSKCAYVGNEDGLTLAPLITLRKSIYDVNVVLFTIEFASRNSQRFFNNQYGNYGRSSATSGSTYVGVLDSVSSSSATYSKTTPYSQASTYSTSDQVYKYRGVECCFNTYYWIVGDVANSATGYKICSDVSTISSYSSWAELSSSVSDVVVTNGSSHLLTKAGFYNGIIYPRAVNGTTYNANYYADGVFSTGYSNYPLLLLGGSNGSSYSACGAFYCDSYSWGGGGGDSASRPCLSVS